MSPTSRIPAAQRRTPSPPPHPCAVEQRQALGALRVGGASAAGQAAQSGKALPAFSRARGLPWQCVAGVNGVSRVPGLQQETSTALNPPKTRVRAHACKHASTLTPTPSPPRPPSGPVLHEQRKQRRPQLGEAAALRGGAARALQHARGAAAGTVGLGAPRAPARCDAARLGRRGSRAARGVGKRPATQQGSPAGKGGPSPAAPRAHAHPGASSATPSSRTARGSPAVSPGLATAALPTKTHTPHPRPNPAHARPRTLRQAADVRQRRRQRRPGCRRQRRQRGRAQRRRGGRAHAGLRQQQVRGPLSGGGLGRRSGRSCGGSRAQRCPKPFGAGAWRTAAAAAAASRDPAPPARACAPFWRPLPRTASFGGHSLTPPLPRRDCTQVERDGARRGGSWQQVRKRRRATECQWRSFRHLLGGPLDLAARGGHSTLTVGCCLPACVRVCCVPVRPLQHVLGCEEYSTAGIALHTTCPPVVVHA